jgi:hypothetical protein
LRLKDASRFKYVEDEDSDMETSESKACKTYDTFFFCSLVHSLKFYLFNSSSSTKDDPDVTFVSKETASKTEYVFLAVFDLFFSY